MPRRARLFSELAEDTEPLATGRITSAPIIHDGKRRKTSGLNSRLDRMVQTMNDTHRSPVRSARNRTRSTGSSTSGSSIPRTPIDGYESYHQDGRLGSEFSVIKMGGSSMERHGKTPKRPEAFGWDQNLSSDNIESPPPPPAAPLPAWLASTFSTLTAKHPLRLLLPRRTDSETSISLPTVETVEEDQPFAFCVSVQPIVDAPTHNTLVEAENHVEPSLEPAHVLIGLQSPKSALVYRPSSGPMFDAVLPFSTPGSASLISSHSVVSDSHSVPPEPSYANCAPSFKPFRHSTPIIAVTYGAHDACSSDDPPAFYHDYDQSATDDSASDPLPIQHAYIDLFSTPGPAYRAPQPIYFDSPSEAPSDSDPLQPGYELDYDALDFKWAPFIQKTTTEDERRPPAPKPLVAALDPVVISNSDDYYYETRVDPEDDDEDGQLYASVNLGAVPASPLPEQSPSPGRFSFAPPADHPATVQGEAGEETEKAPTTPEPTTPESTAPQFFAPAPGIFVSPLRSEKSQTMEAEEAQVVDKTGSQVSNDSIEDWDDAAE